MKLTILGALPRELTYIIKNLGATKSSERQPFPVYLSKAGTYDIIIAQTGVGMVRAAAAMKSVLEMSAPDCVISVGYAGALYPGSVPGELIRGSRFFLFASSATSFLMQSEVKPVRPLEESLAERVSGMEELRQGSIITVEQPQNKTILAEQIPDDLPFPVVDMETYALARLSLEKNVPFLAVRSISDPLDEVVPPELAGVIDEMGQPKLGTLLHAVTTNPALVTDVLRLRRNSEAAAKNLGMFVKELLKVT